MKYNALSIFALGLFSLTGCESHQNPFTMSLSDVMSLEKTYQGVVFSQNGPSGPYQQGPSVAGYTNEAGSMTAGSGEGSTKVAWPAANGFTFVATPYFNSRHGAFVVVRKVPST